MGKNNVAGIIRYKITDKPVGDDRLIGGSIEGGSGRFVKAELRWPAANRLYRDAFEGLGTPLLLGEQIVECTKDEFDASLDRELGIDIKLHLQTGQVMTMQEKFLFTSFDTITVEYMQDPTTGEKGDWWKMKAQLYFVGYSIDQHKPLPIPVFRKWRLFDWPKLTMATAQGRVRWFDNINTQDGAKASFRYAYFSQIDKDAPECIIASSDRLVEQLELEL